MTCEWECSIPNPAFQQTFRHGPVWQMVVLRRRKADTIPQRLYSGLVSVDGRLSIPCPVRQLELKAQI